MDPSGSHQCPWTPAGVGLLDAGVCVRAAAECGPRLVLLYPSPKEWSLTIQSQVRFDLLAKLPREQAVVLQIGVSIFPGLLTTLTRTRFPPFFKKLSFTFGAQSLLLTSPRAAGRISVR